MGFHVSLGECTVAVTILPSVDACAAHEKGPGAAVAARQAFPITPPIGFGFRV